MEPHGCTSRADGNFLELESDEELLCSVSDIAEHLGRNIAAVLQAALTDIRKMVSIRIRVLKMELREKNQEIELLKAKLRGDAREPFAGAASAEPCADGGLKKLPELPRHNCVDPRRAKALLPGVKRENIDAICDYLMKDKNSRGCSDADGDHSSDKEPRQEAEGHPLHLWPDSGISGSVQGDSDSTAEDLFSMIPSGSKRMYDYEWIPPMEYSSSSSDLKGEGESAVAVKT